MEQKIDEIRKKWSGSRWGESNRKIADDAVVDIPALLNEIDRLTERAGEPELAEVEAVQSRQILINQAKLLEREIAGMEAELAEYRDAEKHIERKYLDGCMQLNKRCPDYLELEEYRKVTNGMTIDELKELIYIRKRYEDEEYDYCGEYGTEECPLADKREVKKESCQWVQICMEYGDTYSCDGCDAIWNFNEGNPFENKMYHCPQCGRKITTVTTRELNGDDVEVNRIITRKEAEAALKEEKWDCGECQREDAPCDFCIRNEENTDKEDPDLSDYYYHEATLERKE